MLKYLYSLTKSHIGGDGSCAVSAGIGFVDYGICPDIKNSGAIASVPLFLFREIILISLLFSFLR